MTVVDEIFESVMAGPVDFSTIEEVIPAFLRDFVDRTAPPPLVFSHDWSESQPIFVVGDTHGEVSVVRGVVEKLLEAPDPALFSPRFPLRGNRPPMVIFLGDYVDRGAFGLETLLLVLALKLKYPRQVITLRGNHEDLAVNADYGFLVEIAQKLSNPRPVIELLPEVYQRLPIVLRVEGSDCSFLCVHGGIPVPERGSATREPIKLNTLGHPTNVNTQGLTPAALVDQFLWNDPVAHGNGDDDVSPSPRGVGYLFGPRAYEAFRKRNHLDFVVRAHQYFQSGYRVFFGNPLEKESRPRTAPLADSPTIVTPRGPPSTGGHRGSGSAAFHVIRLPDPMGRLVSLFSCAKYRRTRNHGALLRVDPGPDLAILEYGHNFP